jgi:hypothetical protein
MGCSSAIGTGAATCHIKNKGNEHHEATEV